MCRSPGTEGSNPSLSAAPAPSWGGRFALGPLAPEAKSGPGGVAEREGHLVPCREAAGEDGGVERSAELASQYVSQLYHQVGDEWTSDWNFEGIVEDNLLLHRVGTRLANEGQWPNWGEGSEFKAVRDESADQRN